MRTPHIDRVLTQEEIDSVFKNLRHSSQDEQNRKAQTYDFRRPDRIAKDQLRAIHALHENFARSLASSLSAYLRAYVMVNIVSVEQLSFMEFTQCLPSPTIITALAMRPYDGNAVLELNPSLVFPVIEILLGGSGKSGQLKMEREVTEIEQSVLDGLYRIILHDMQQAWGAVTSLDFEYSNIETEPQMLQILAPNEAVVAISMEIRVGESAGMMNIGIPSIIIKMLRQKFDQQWSMRKSESTEVEHERMFRLIQPSLLNIDCRLSGPTITVQDFLQLEEGHVLRLDYAVDRPVKLVLNGYEKFTGYVVDTGRKLAFQVHQPVVRESLRLELKAAS